MKYDLLIKNVKIIDGISDVYSSGDIAVKKGRIVKVGKVEKDATATKTVDGTGLTATPGFFDIHSHIDRSLMDVPTADNQILQGITCALAGHCAGSGAPDHNPAYHQTMVNRLGHEFPWRTFEGLVEAQEKAGTALNLFNLVGTNALRASAMTKGWNRPANASEIKKMKEYTEEAMKAGAYGVSYSGDAGVPSHWMTFEELKEVLTVCKKYDGVFAPHTRHHQFQYWSGKKGESIYGLYDGPKGEMFVGRYHGLLEASEVCFAAGGCRLHISHITPSTLIYHPHPASLDYALAEATLEDIVDAPYRKGLDITFDVLCSDFSIGAEKRLTTDLTAGALIRPKWMEIPAAKGADRITIKDGKTPALEKHFAEQMKKSDAAAKLKDLFDSGNMKVGMLHPVQDPYWFDCYRILKCKKKEYEGKMLSDIVFSKGKPTVESVYSVIYDVLVDILRADPLATWALVKDKREYKAMNVFMKHPLGTIGTDMGRTVPLRNAGKNLSGTETTLYGSGPYLFNGFIQYLVNATRRDCVMSMPQAIKHITSIPAQKVLHLENYGVLRENAWANIVLMDESKLGYTIDFSDPSKAPTGLEYVFVNGKASLAKGKLTGVINGHVVRKGGIYE